MLLAGVLSFARHTNSYRLDPDRYFHLALSKQMVESTNFIPRALPQIIGLHWDKYFPDKEFLFHQLTALGFKLGGENGVANIVLTVAILSFFSIYLLAAQIVHPALALFLCIVTLECATYLNRMVMLRPHILSIFLFSLLLHAVYRRSIILGFLAGTLTSLAYHGLFIPLTPTLAAAIVFYFYPLDRKVEKEFILASLFGVAFGALINPYFPSNLVMGWIHVQIPSLLHGDLSQLSFGNELYPMNTYTFLKLLPAPIIVLAIAMFSLLKVNPNKKLEQDKLIFSLCAGVFFLMCLESSRAKEYWIPTSAVLAAILFQHWEDQKKIRNSLVCFSAIFPAIFFSSFLFQKLPDPKDIVIGEMQALQTLPAKESGGIVFNCDWETTPFIFYQRPDLHFIDILDPSFLFFMNREAFLVRQQLNQGQIGDPYGLVHDAFGGNYALCKNVGVVSIMRQDPDFIELYPGKIPVRSDTEQAVLFRLRPTSSPEFLHKFTVSLIRNSAAINQTIKSPENIEHESSNEIAEPTTYLNFNSHLKKELELESSQIHCALSKLSQSELANFDGANYMGIGGGQNIRVWRNGKPFYSSVNGIGVARRINVLVPVPGGIKPNDQFSMITCSSASFPFWGIALSLWTTKQIEKTCLEKKAFTPENSDSVSWQYSGVNEETCIGPIVPASSQKL